MKASPLEVRFNSRGGMASSSSKEKLNFQCVSEASLELIRLPLKDILLGQIRPDDLFLKIQSSFLLYGRNKLRPDQLKICYFPPPVLPDYNKFDVILLYTLIRNLCPGLEPTRGWGHEPGQCDIQIGDDIERLRLFRNNTFAHLSSASIPDDTFQDVWKTLISVLVRVKSHSGCSVDYVQELREIEYSHNDGNKFHEIDVTQPKYYGSNLNPEYPRLVIGRTNFDDKLFYRLYGSNTLGETYSNTVYLKIAGGMSFLKFT